jgi:uncharacterized membrane protein
MQPHNLTGILIASIAAWIFGAVYYTVLGPRWIAAQGKTVEQHKAEFAAKSKLMASLPFLLSFIGAFIMGVVLYGIMTHSGLFSARAGAISGAFCWFGFVLTTVAVNNAYTGRRWSLTLIDTVHWLFVLVIVGAIVGWFGR